MNLKEKRKAESRERILKAAAELFQVKGFSATGIDELMAEAGLTAGAFYAHFKSKQDLLDKTIEHLMAGSARRLTGGLDFKGGERFVEEMMNRYVSGLHRDNPEAGCAIPAIAGEIARHSRNGKKTVGAYVDRWADLFAKNLKRKSADKRADSLRLISQAVGAVLLARLVPSELSEEILEASRKI